VVLDAVLQELAIQFYSPYSQIVDFSRGMPWPQWCVGGEMNIITTASTSMRHPTDSHIAVRWEGKKGWSARSLRGTAPRSEPGGQRAPLARPGQRRRRWRVHAMTPEIVVAMLAIMKIGAFFCRCSPVSARSGRVTIGGCGGKALFTRTVYFASRTVPMKPVADEAAAAVPTLQHFIVFKRVGLSVSWTPARSLVARVDAAQTADAPTERTSTEDPLMIIYTSGTTGRPRAPFTRIAGSRSKPRRTFCTASTCIATRRSIG